MENEDEDLKLEWVDEFFKKCVNPFSGKTDSTMSKTLADLKEERRIAADAVNGALMLVEQYGLLIEDLYKVAYREAAEAVVSGGEAETARITAEEFEVELHTLQHVLIHLYDIKNLIEFGKHP